MPRVRLRYFSIIRDMTGRSGEEVEVSGNMTVGEFLNYLGRRYPELGEFMKYEGHLIVLVDGKAVNRDAVLRGGEEVALLPPVSGGSLYRGELAEEVDIARVVGEAVRSAGPETGAVAVFLGVVKGIVEGARVLELRYEVYEPYAETHLQKIAEEVGRRYGLSVVMIRHCKGAKRPGEPVLAVVVAARSRDEAFKGLIEAVERVKTEPPIFKLEVRDDGEYWVVGERRVRRGASPREAAEALGGGDH
ncbi:MAG: MoaD family protein [Thermoprotei archaeon]|nr:MAG: MoaD family protein [Thermoprotei archaeon]RLE97927.1 MAG: MoaD family protein [Thermoprotei archaeon]